jgi:hypothetical protein
LSAKPEKNYRAKTKQADSQSGYLEDKIVGSTYINVTEEDGTVGKRLKVEVDASALVAGIVDHKVKVSSNDTTANYLLSKLVAGNAITLTEQNPAGNENILIDGAYTAGAGISITGASIASTITQVVTEDPFTGHATKVPVSKAVAELLQALYITDATDCGVTGNALIHKVKDIPLGSCSFVEVADTPSFASHYPSTGEVLSKIPVWSTSGSYGRGYGRGKGNSLIIYSDESEGTAEYTAAICNLSTDEDNVIPNTKLWVDVLFECVATADQVITANVKCQPCFYDGTTLISSLPYLPEAVVKQVEYPIADSRIRKVTYEIEIGNDIPDSKWLYGALVFTCDASATAKEARIVGLRVRYATKTIGLRAVDVEP